MTLGAVVIVSLMLVAFILLASAQRPTVRAESGGSNSTVTPYQPPRPASNATAPPFVPQCFTYPANYVPSYHPIGAASITTSSPATFSPGSDGVVISVLCNGCGGQTSTTQWEGTFGPIFGATNTTPSVSGICNESFLVERPSSSAWLLSWSFQRLASTGTLEIMVSLNINNTVVYEDSTTGPVTILSGSLNLPAIN